MKSVPAWVPYSVYRVLMFAFPLAVLLVLQVEWWLAAILAAVVGLCLSYIFLRKRREGVSRDLYAARHPDTEPVHPDAESAFRVDSAGLHVCGSERGDQPEEDEDEQFAEAVVAVGLLAARVEPGRGDGGGTDQEQPPLLGEDHQGQSGERREREEGQGHAEDRPSGRRA